MFSSVTTTRSYIRNKQKIQGNAKSQNPWGIVQPHHCNTIKPEQNCKIANQSTSRELRRTNLASGHNRTLLNLGRGPLGGRGARFGDVGDDRWLHFVQGRARGRQCSVWGGAALQTVEVASDEEGSIGERHAVPARATRRRIERQGWGDSCFPGLVSSFFSAVLRRVFFSHTSSGEEVAIARGGGNRRSNHHDVRFSFNNKDTITPFVSNYLSQIWMYLDVF